MPAFLMGLTLFFYWKVLFTNRAMFTWDAVDFFYPYFSFVHEELRHFRLPLWNPYVMSGYPIIGDLEAQIFYPLNWLFVLLSPFSPLPYRLVEIQIILHFFLAGLFMYYLARDFVQSDVAATFGAVLYMFGGAMVVHTQHVASVNALAWFPLIFLLARRSLIRKSFFHALSAGMVFGIQILAGHWQHSVYLGLFLFLYFAYEACFGPLRARLWPHWIYLLLVAGGVGAALAMVQIIPTRELGFLSARSNLTYWDITAGSEPRYLWTLFLPNFLGGLNGVPQWYPYDLSFNYVFLTVPGCILAMLGLAETVRRRNFFWLGMVLLFTELSFGFWGHLAEVVYRIPILNLFRVMAAYFDVANFGLCLMAAVGAERLFSKTLTLDFKKYLVLGLAALLMFLTALGLLLQLAARIHGWYHMLAALALFCAIVAAMLRNKLSSRVSQGALLALMVFELCFYNMNQEFNASENDPRTYLSYEYAVGRKESLQFLRSDAGGDFRVGAIAESPWRGNGWNVWRIPGIYGWNPIVLRRYEDYIRTFTQTASFLLPSGGSDHWLDSPLLDLLGTKYLVLAGISLEQTLQFKDSSKFKLVFEDFGWWKIYRNKEYLPRGWFYPQAYRVPDQAQVLALMNSSWFEARRALLFEEEDLRGKEIKLVEQIPTITLLPPEAHAASDGSVVVDPDCVNAVPMFAARGGKDNWIQYTIAGPPQPDHYLLLMRYAAGPHPVLSPRNVLRRSPAAQQPAPSLRIKIENGNREQHQGPVRIARTSESSCRHWRTAELGEFEIGPGLNQITITAEAESALNIYSLWLVRLPPLVPRDAESFSFENFSFSANQISFDSQTSRDGFILLNEIYYPGWEAVMDGRRVEILRADGIFRTLFAPAGSHHIELRFRPRYFAWGATLSLLTLLAFATYAVVLRRQRIYPREPPQSTPSFRP